MLEFMKFIKDLKKAEIWGVVIIIALDLSVVLKALSVLETLGVKGFFILIVLLQICLLPVCGYLLHLYSARLGVDDMHEAARNIHITMERLNEQLRTAQGLTEKLQLPDQEQKSSKNLPPE